MLEKYTLRRDAGLVAEDVLKLELLADQTSPPNEEQETSHIPKSTWKKNLLAGDARIPPGYRVTGAARIRHSRFRTPWAVPRTCPQREFHLQCARLREKREKKWQKIAIR